MKPEVMPSVESNIRTEIRNQPTMVQNGRKGKFDKLLERQFIPLQNGSQSNVVIMEDGELSNLYLMFHRWTQRPGGRQV